MSMRHVTALALVTLGLATAPALAQSRAPRGELPVIPTPASARPFEGSWEVPKALPVEVAYLTDAQLAGYGIRVRIVPGDSVSGLESYTLTVAPAAVTVTAPRMAGRLYALMTLAQLVEAARATGDTLARIGSVTITDAPRFPYRGLHLDVVRHFMPVEFVKRYIDLMARWKLNTFHWHLTDDQGWRIEIRKYPRLTEVSSCRKETMVAKNFDPYVGDGQPHCGFYTQDQVRDVVAYAAARNVTVVPEIEMPGHAIAALTAYPEFACTPGPFEVRTTWGVSEDIFCPTEPTFAFLQDILTEVLALFPSKMIHIGGDEAPKVRWDASPIAQAIIKREGLKDSHELQSYFVRRMDKWLTEHGRRLIGWDEILEGGLAPGATVMSWRGTAGGIAAARLGRDVIMTPGPPLYLDHYQGDPRSEPLAIGGYAPLDSVYAYEPIPAELTPDQAKHILGAQGNIWTEYIATPAHVEYMAYPRALALAEVDWSPRASRDWASFSRRLPNSLRQLDRLGVNHRLPTVLGLDRDLLTLEPRYRVSMAAPFAGAEVRYTLDGSDPTPRSPLYTAPFDVTTTFDGVKVTARAFAPNGRASAPRQVTVRRTNYRESEDIQFAALELGLSVAYYETAVRTVVGLDTLRPTKIGKSDVIDRSFAERDEQYALIFRGYLAVPEDGMFEFALSSDDGSSLLVGDDVIIDNDGFHGAQERTGMVALRAGPHPMTLRYFQGGGGQSLRLRVRVNGGAWQLIPRIWLQRKQGAP